MTDARFHLFSENSLLLSFDRLPFEEAYERVQYLYDYARDLKDISFQNLVPAYNSLLLVCNNSDDVPVVQSLLQSLQPNISASARKSPAPEKVIPVCYDPVLGNDLEYMAHTLGISVPEIINLHAKRTYHVYLLGFLPGFAYMGQVDERIAMPRKASPVPTRAGAVGIAGLQTGIYPQNSPGGWQIIGYTPLTMFDLNREHPSLLNPGDLVKFEPISSDDFIRIKNTGVWK